MTQTREALIALAEKLSVLKGRIHAELSGIELQTMTQAIDALASVREWQPLHDLRMEMETHLHLALEEEQRGNTRPDASEVLKIYLGRIAQMLPDPPKETRNQYPFACGNCPPCVAGRWWTCETPKTEETPEAQPNQVLISKLKGQLQVLETLSTHFQTVWGMRDVQVVDLTSSQLDLVVGVLKEAIGQMETTGLASRTQENGK